jgi:Transposase IS4
LTTAYNLTDTVIRPRNRPSSTSTSASITRPIFGPSPRKDLPIPVAIDAYNHYMGGVDIANQYRAAFTTLQHRSNRYWKPLFHWLLDIALVNSYLLAKAIQGLVIEKSKLRRHHRQFQEALAKALMIYTEAPEHNQVLRLRRTYCAYCRKNQHWKPRQQGRPFGADITNIAGGSGGRFRGSMTKWGCDSCNIPLCKIGDCWHLWHRRFN